jgi:hypothetical protein
MNELKTIEAIINKALSKGVFENCADIAAALQALQTLAQTIKNLESGSNSTNN